MSLYKVNTLFYRKETLWIYTVGVRTMRSEKFLQTELIFQRDGFNKKNSFQV